MQPALVDHTGKVIQLGPELGRGGEGAVFEHAIDPRLVIKIYHKAVGIQKAAKLRAMVAAAHPDILKYAAWPTATVHRAGNAEPCGIILPRIKDAYEVHELYSPAQRRVRFPDANWRFLLGTARNCAAAFSSLHSHGIVVGDVNQGNILVTRNAFVRIIDCDSFQLATPAETFLCLVGVPHFTPPELHSADFSKTTRTREHDRFGLAVLIFHLLFLGRHPFAGRFAGAGDMPIERAIRELRFAYSRDAARLQMAPPPHAIALDSIDSELAQMFEKAFSRDAARGASRPAAGDWVSALDRAITGLKDCEDDGGHVFAQHLGECPWCHILTDGGPNFFISVTLKTVAAAPQLDISRVWAEIGRLPRPGSRFERASRTRLQPLVPRPVPSIVDEGIFFRRMLGCVAIGSTVISIGGVIEPIIAALSLPVAMVFAVWFVVLWSQSPMHLLRADRAGKVRKAEKRKAAIIDNGRLIMAAAQVEFDNVLNSAASKKADLDNIPREHKMALQQLIDSAEAQQRQEYLESVYLCNSKIDGIGQGRLAVLAAYGIETAADLNANILVQVPGIGPHLTNNLMAWRGWIEHGFRFDRARGVPPAAFDALEMQFLQKKQQLERLILRAPSVLKKIEAECRRSLEELDVELAASELDLEQAKLDWQVLNSSG